MLFTTPRPALSFIVIFLAFSLLYLSNSFKLWFKTDQYYAEMQESLKRAPAFFRDFFLTRLNERETWLTRQKVFSVAGAAAVLCADALLISAYMR